MKNYALKMRSIHSTQIGELRNIFLLTILTWVSQLTAQAPLEQVTEALKSNVVALSVKFADGEELKGFGIITAEQNGRLFLATVAHVVRGVDNNQTAKSIKVRFYNDYRWFDAAFIRHWDQEDLALLEMVKPGFVQWEKDCADFSPQNLQKVRFLGLNGSEPSWVYPGSGEVFKLLDNTIQFAIGTIRPGTSGAPLITEKGIVGIIIEDEGGFSTALRLTQIKALFTEGGQYPYFELNQPDPYSLVFVKGGTFTMGCTSEQGNECDDDEKTSHQVTLDDFYIGKYEVTQAQWRSIMGSDPQNLNFKGCDQCPVEGVSWEDIQDFLKKLNAKTGKKYRLPTEAEWEYAARGGNQNRGYKYVGSNIFYEVLWYDPNSGSKTYPVGGKKSNELGLYDMNGNAWEWCQDWYGPYSSNKQMNPEGPSSGPSRVLRGGGWSIDSGDFRVSNRTFSKPSNRDGYLGFRLGL